MSDSVIADVSRALVACFPDRAEDVLAQVEEWRRLAESRERPYPPVAWISSALRLINIAWPDGRWIEVNNIAQSFERDSTWRVPSTHAFIGTTLTIIAREGRVTVENVDRNIRFLDDVMWSALLAPVHFAPVPLCVRPGETLRVAVHGTARLDGVLVRTRDS